MDRWSSRRAPFLLCLLCLTGATVLLAVGTNIGLWIAGRVLQGVSAGMLWVVCLALLIDTVGPAGIGQAVGLIGVPMSIGPIVGPILGGVLYSQGGYYAVFGLMCAMLGVDALLRLAMIEKKVAQKWAAIRTPESEAVNVHAESCSRQTSIPHIDSPRIIYDGTVENAEACTEAFPPGQRRSHQLPSVLKLLLSYRMVVGLTGGLLQSSLNVAFDSTLPLIVVDLFGWQQTGQGLIFITILLPSLLQPLFGRMTDRYKQGRRLLAGGGCLLAVPAYVLLRLVTHDTLRQKALLCALLVIIGLAMAMAMPAIIAEISATVEDTEKDDPEAIKGSVMATGWSFVNAAYAAGCLVGPLFAGLIRGAAGWQTMTWCLGVLSAVTGIFLLLCLGGWIGNVKAKTMLERVPRSEDEAVTSETLSPGRNKRNPQQRAWSVR